METELFCPLGSKCQEAKDGKLYQCHWYTQVAGKNPQSEEVTNEWRCAMTWMPILMVENAQQIRGMTAATESFRNESVKGQDIFNNLIASATGRKQIDG